MSEIITPPADHFQLMIEKVASIIRSGSDFSLFNNKAALIARLADQMERFCPRNEDDTK